MVFVELLLLLLRAICMPSAFRPMAFLPFFCLSVLSYLYQILGGELMDEDNDIFDLFQEMMASLDQENPEGRMRVLSQNPRFDETTEPKPKNQIPHGR